MKEVSESINSYVSYHGSANKKAAYTDAVWRIKRIVKNNGILSEEYADEGRFSQVWQDRALLFEEIPPIDTSFNLGFVCSTGELSSGAIGENPQRLLIKNPVGSDKTMKIYKFIITTNVSSSSNIFNFYINPIITDDGEALLILPLNLDDAVKPSLMEFFKVPATSDDGKLLMSCIVGPTSTLILPLDKEILVPAGKTLLINVSPSAEGATFSINTFYVETF